MFRINAFITSVMLCLATGQALGASNSDAAAFAAAVEKARAEQLDMFAPKAFAAAVQASQAASREAERGRAAEKVASRVQEGQTALQRARSVADGARQTLGGVIKTREDAIAAGAPKLSGEVWTKAAERFQQAMRENESGDMQGAQKRAAEAEVLLRDAELIAIKGGILNEARARNAQGDAAKVAKFAPSRLQIA